jgi:hypothetical protein
MNPKDQKNQPHNDGSVNPANSEVRAAYLDALRRFGDRPSPEMLAQGWAQFKDAWGASDAER